MPYLQASEAGLLGEHKLTPYKAGIFGALNIDFIDKVVIEKLVYLLKNKIPIFTIIIENTKNFIKQFLTEKLTQVANKAYDFLKTKLSKIFA